MSPQERKQLEDLLKKINDTRRELGLKAVDMINIGNIEQAKKELDVLRDSLFDMDDSAADVFSKIKDITKEFKNQISDTATIRGNFRGLKSLAEEIKDDEAGISDYSSKDLANMLQKGKLQRQRIKDYSRYLIQDKLSLDQQKELSNIQEEITQGKMSQDDINQKITEYAKSSKNISEEEAEMLKSYYDDQENVLDKLISKTQQRLDIEKTIDKKVAGFTLLADLTDNLPGLRAFSEPFKDAEKSARQAVKTAKGAKKTGFGQVMAGAGAGMSSLIGSLAKALGPALLLAKVIQFVVDLFISANKNMITIAKNLGISRSAAEGLRQEFIGIAAASDNVLVNSESLIEAQKELIDVLGAVTKGSMDLAESQVFLTKNLGISGERAAELQLLFGASNQEALNLFDTVNANANAQALQNGYLISAQDIFREISDTNAEISGYFGFQTKELANAVIQTRRLGLNLAASQKVAEGLLDFESSIRNEIQAELFLGKELNFQRARALAFQGKFGLATEEVVSQLTNLTEAQRRNPIVMKAAADAAGLTVEQLNRSFLIQTKLNKEQRDYVRSLRDGGQEEKANFFERRALQGSDTAEIMKTLTAQDKFNAALAKAKDQFSGLVEGGALDQFAQVVVEVTDRLIKLFGLSADAAEGLNENNEARIEILKKQGKVTEDITKIQSDYAKQLEKRNELSEEGDYARKVVNYMNPSGAFLTSALMKRSTDIEMYSKQKELTSAINIAEAQDTDDFIIRPGEPIQKFDKGDLVIGGTNLMGGGSNKRIESLLEKLVGAVESGGNVFIDGNKAGRAMVLGAHKLS